MTKETPNGIDRIESAANISLALTQGSKSGDTDGATMAEVPISRLDTTKDIEIEEIRESSQGDWLQHYRDLLFGDDDVQGQHTDPQVR